MRLLYDMYLLGCFAGDTNLLVSLPMIWTFCFCVVFQLAIGAPLWWLEGTEGFTWLSLGRRHRRLGDLGPLPIELGFGWVVWVGAQLTCRLPRGREGSWDELLGEARMV